MKKLIVMMVSMLSFCMLSFGQQVQAPPQTASTNAEQLMFMGVTSVHLQIRGNGDLVMIANIRYNNKSGKKISVTDVQAQTLVLDKRFDPKVDAYSLAYGDVCQSGNDTTGFFKSENESLFIRDYYKKFACGIYEPETISAAVQSIIFEPGVNEMEFVFNLGNLIDINLTKKASEQLEGFSIERNAVVSNAILEKFIRISNATNGKDKNECKLVIVMKGTANYSGNTQDAYSVVIGKVQMIGILGRMKVDYIFANKNLGI